MPKRAHSQEELQAAKKAYRAAHWGRSARRVQALGVPDPTKHALVELGLLRTVVYETDKGLYNGPQLFAHDFSTKNAPVLCFDRDGDGLFVCGGGYRVTWRGIVG